MASASVSWMYDWASTEVPSVGVDPDSDDMSVMRAGSSVTAGCSSGW